MANFIALPKTFLKAMYQGGRHFNGGSRINQGVSINQGNNSGETKFITTSSGAHIPIGGASDAKDKSGSDTESTNNQAQSSAQNPHTKDNQQISQPKEQTPQEKTTSDAMNFATDSKQNEMHFDDGKNQVQFKFNTNRQGKASPNVVQVIINKQGGAMGFTSQTFERPTNQVPQLLAQLQSKGYAHTRSTMKAWRFKAGNPHHDMLTGQFTGAGGNAVLDRKEQSEKKEHQEFRAHQQEMQRPAPGQLILPEQQARENNTSTSDNIDIESASKETGGSRVFNFSTGERTDLDKNVKFVTNTNAEGKFEKGALRVEIFNPETQKRTIYAKPMSQLPILVNQVKEKKYGAISQHRRNTAHVLKADEPKGRWVTSNGKHIFISEQEDKERAEKMNDPECLAKTHNQYTTTKGATVSDPESLDYKDLSWDDLQSLPADTVIRVKHYTAKKGGRGSGMSRTKIKVGNLILKKDNTQKADQKFITVNGKHIPIGSERKPTSLVAQKEQSNAGSDLTHEQRQTIVSKMAQKMGLSPDSIQVAEHDQPDDFGTPMGEYDPDTKKITIFPEGFKSREELIGTIAHESSHMNLDKVLDAYNQQREQYASGAHPSDVPIYNDLRQVFSESNRATYQIAGGQSSYGDTFWEKYKSEPTPQNYLTAISESLAESQRLVATGRENDVHPQFRSLLNKVNNYAKGL